MNTDIMFQDVFVPWNSAFFYSTVIRSSERVFYQSAFPKSDANLFEWLGTIEGVSGTVRLFFWAKICVLISCKIYSGLRFKISISFPSNYPYAPPLIKFDSPCFHPNVDIQSGGICLDILQVSDLLQWFYDKVFRVFV
jgi:ubiquitin-protein ligase